MRVYPFIDTFWVSEMKLEKMVFSFVNNPEPLVY